MTRSDKKPILKGRKKAMVEAMARHLGLVTYAAKEARISRNAHYNWLKKDKVYREAIEDLNELKEDLIEKAFLSLVIDKNAPAVIHAVKTKLKNRGYGESYEIKQENNTDLVLLCKEYLNDGHNKESISESNNK